MKVRYHALVEGYVIYRPRKRLDGRGEDPAIFGFTCETESIAAGIRLGRVWRTWTPDGRYTFRGKTRREATGKLLEHIESRLTKRQQTMLAVVRREGRVIKDQRVRSTVEALEESGLVDVDWDAATEDGKVRIRVEDPA